MNDKNKRPSMRDFGLNSFQGFAPEWSEQYKRQEKYVEALDKWEKQEKQRKDTNNE